MTDAVEQYILDHIDPSHNFAVRIAEESNLSDLTYLYRYGEYITENKSSNAVLLFQFVASLHL